MRLSLSQKIIQQLQQDLPLTPQPFKVIAQRVGTTEEQVLALLTQYIEQGLIRRLGAVLNHQRLGFEANGMGVWRVPATEVARIGQIMASFPEVTHCYERPSTSEWPYNLYTMIHGATKEECYQVAQRICRATGITEYKLLFSCQEFKKSSMQYY